MTMQDIGMCNKATLLPSVSSQTGLRVLFNETNHSFCINFKFSLSSGILKEVNTSKVTAVLLSDAIFISSLPSERLFILRERWSF